ncbi:response regulator [Leptospira sp. 2 VSF19]|uniref:Response regulator n=1 Tax=Leptospira soteropolitanensis TaxID=2950025 RepID=A0AAW5VA71_9LEPT|nr:response regulator [Leptospira soteropolitanensis]MCW7491770.1 response regulator [Leptospira soteropolitanensis]MCW7499355.1 response regulator [Leptospira soteropolitanensis]MCW7521054.1 response regulator [Leptospira soteropolitanensis]MCW7525458.1 response regulator [Leptospira soteropolitanensis]MCW7529325.1 response regulator [Leptospira soteropolitanensis]
MNKINLACVVEDDPIHLFLTKQVISLSGLVKHTLVCQNGKEAYEMLSSRIDLKESLPELILLDLNMPIWDGWQFLDEFTSIPVNQKITIYIVTSSSSEEDLIRAEKYNLRGNYIVKPITIDKLREIIYEMN